MAGELVGVWVKCEQMWGLLGWKLLGGNVEEMLRLVEKGGFMVARIGGFCELNVKNWAKNAQIMPN
jgi:hypothetical protein